jgi:DNA invertase Pin-like site-specific DNA recombinase
VTLIGYDLLSGRDNGHEQRQKLMAKGCRHVFVDEWGKSVELQRVKNELATSGMTEPTLVVCSLDRAANNYTSLLALVLGLEADGTRFLSLAENWFIGPDNGHELLRAVRDLAKFRRTVAVNRSNLGLLAAEKKGRLSGRPRSLSPEEIEKAASIIRSGQTTVAELAKVMKIGTATLYRYLSTTTNETK